MARTQRRSGGKVKFFVGGFLVCVIGSVAAFQGYKMKQEVGRYEGRLKELEEELGAEQERTEEIREYSEYVNSDEYVEEVARDKLGLVYDDEVLLKANEDE